MVTQENNRIHCPICGCNIFDNKETYINSCFKTNIFAHKDIAVCSSCNFGFVTETISQKELDLFYSEQYRAKGTIFRKKLTLIPKVSKRALSQWMLINTFKSFESVNNINILDIGAGYGDTFDIAKTIFPASSNYAFEPDKNTKKHLSKKKVNIYEETFSKNTKVKEKFDVIIMSHVLEHYNSEDIMPILKNISNHLSANGILLIEVPNDDFKNIRKLRKNDAPHLSFFSVDALSHAIKNSGMQLLYANTCGKTLVEYYLPPPINANSMYLTKINRRLNVIKKPMFYFDSDFFRYGENRIWIRTIARKIN
jgi:2-polyprenyl-3-methyl-5-hydroxy-6-metoxy-1,4-benzoquinol methylase